MKVMVYEGPKKIILQEVGDPTLHKDQIRIQTMFTGISHGTEMNVYRGTAPFFKRKRNPETWLFEDAEQDAWAYPIRSCDPGVWYMGYASVGKVIEKGADVQGIEIGDVVYTNAPHQSQVLRNPADVVKLPDGIKPEYGIFFTNLMTAFNGILDTKIKLGDTVVVSGLGVLGQLTAQMAKLSGAKVYGVDLFEKRRSAALANGIDGVFNPADGKDIANEIRKLTGNRGPDAVIENSGNVKALNEAIRIAAPDTAVTAVGWYQGLCGDLNLAEEFHHNRIALRCSQTCGINPEIRHMWNDSRKAQTCIDLLGKLKFENLITDVIPYERIADAYQTIDQNPASIIQVALQY